MFPDFSLDRRGVGGDDEPLKLGRREMRVPCPFVAGAPECKFSRASSK